MRKKLINKVAKKKFEGRCCLCGIDDYAVLDCHRIVPGEDDGIYSEHNCIVTCANCHRRIHDGQIVIDRKYYSSSGKCILHLWEDGVEKWL